MFEEIVNMQYCRIIHGMVHYWNQGLELDQLVRTVDLAIDELILVIPFWVKLGGHDETITKIIDQIRRTTPKIAPGTEYTGEDIVNRTPDYIRDSLINSINLRCTEANELHAFHAKKEQENLG